MPTLATDLLLLLVSFVIILAGAELFTNGVEWLGVKFGLGEGMVGSVLAAVGTAMPETMIPIIAILFVGTAESEEVGIGAILGAPFMLSTAAMFVTGVAVLIFSRRGRRSTDLKVNQVILRRDLRFFLAMYVIAIALGIPAIQLPDPVKYAGGAALVLMYVLYVRQTARDPKTDAGHQELNALHSISWGLSREAMELLSKHGMDAPVTRAVLAQVVVALALIVVGANLFVGKVESVAHTFGVPALVLSLIIAPLATELPEKFNSVLWVRQKKDTLAMGNISGAMVFQSCIPVAIGLWFTPWVLNEFAIASAVVAIAAGLLMQLFLRSGSALNAKELTSLGILYAAFIVYVVAFPHGAGVPIH